MLTNRPKILFCMHMPPPVHGAAVVGQQIYDSELIRQQFECSYINVSTSASLNDVGLFSVAKLIRTVAFYRHLLKALREQKPDLVYFTPSTAGWAFYRDAITVHLLKSRGQNIVLHFHNKSSDAYVNRWYNKLVWERFFNGVYAIFLGYALAKQFEEYTVKSRKIFICPNGMPDSDKVEYGRLMHSPRDRKPYTFLFLSNMIETKGVYVLLEACALLKKRGYSFRCDFVGQWFDVTQEAFKAKCVQLGVEDYVMAYGAKYGAEKECFWQDADAFVFPTYYPSECFPLVLIEAMRCALPILSTDEAAIPEIIENGKTGWLIEKQNAQELANKMEWTITHPTESEQMGRAGRLKFEQNYTLAHFEKRLSEILTDCGKC